ncbi:MAG: DEAD/DEAH box helicase, partial [Planctomycetaceae bacterium]|nr:DEAD/DEAH box helicase [Planctomycetaceae bacterium]
FDFELQATADDEGFILSLGPQHSFPIESLFPMLRTDNVRNLLEQALLAVPLFQMRWRWNVTRALQVDRRRNGKKVAPALQRFRSEDLLTAVFPKLTGCQEEHTGDHVIPDHPLVRQTVEDCMTEALDLEGLLEILDRVQRGEITFVARDTREPSPFAYELLNANPYAFLDGGEIQERRARAVATRRSISIESVQDLGHLDPDAIVQVVREAQPLVRNADELHDVLLSRLWLSIDDADSGLAAHLKCAAKPCDAFDTFEWRDHYAALEADGRATTVTLADGRRGWVAAECLPAVNVVFPEGICDPWLSVPDGVRTDWTTIEARVTAVRGFMEVAGPVTPADVAQHIGMTVEQADAALEALEGEGVVLRGRFTPEGRRANVEGQEISPDSTAADTSTLNPQPSTLNSQLSTEWCHRRLLARIHRLTVAGLRREIEPVDVATFMRFLARHQGVHPASRKQGANGLFETIGQLQGLDLSAVAWERDVLRSRVESYREAWLDELCLTGEVGWGRLYPPARDADKSRPMTSITRVAPVSLFLREDLSWLRETAVPADVDSLSSPAREVLDLLRQRGAVFATDLLSETRMLPSQVDEALGELVARGFVTSDGFAGLRKIARAGNDEDDNSKSSRGSRTVTRRRSATGVGRWSVWREDEAELSRTGNEDRERRREVVEEWAWQLLRRWGVIFRDLLHKEPGAPRWWELTQVYRRLEARGEIRGGRFIEGVAGEQFGTSDTVRELRRLRNEGTGDENKSDELLSLSAVDPLNLVGIISRHPRVPSRPSNRVVLINGQPVAQ